MPIDSAHPGLGLKDRVILIVADDQNKVNALRGMLTKEGYLVSRVNSGQAAIDYYKQFEPDLILLDVGLPQTNVFDVCRNLKNPYSGTPATVIFITSKNNADELVAGLAAGGVDFIVTPFNEKAILARVKVHLRNRLRLVQLYKEERAKTLLMCVTAHDLRNPATSIRALAHSVLSGAEGRLNAEQADTLKTIYDASQSMLDLINNLLDASVLEASEMKVNPEPASLVELVDEEVRLINATASEKGSTVVHHGGDVPSRLMLDKPKIRQVLGNLIGNAVKFSPPGSVVSVEEKCENGQCTVAVSDQGPGVPEDEHDKLFKDFGRTSVKPTGGEPSTGLGLSICYKIMQAHGGSIHAENRPGGGATFYIGFPLTT
jgi:signal transduction histidine kinase